VRSPRFGLLLAALTGALSLWAYPRLPAAVAIHWGVSGRPDRYGSPLVAVLVIPLIILGLNGLLTVLPRIDPRRANYERFRDSYWLLGNAVSVFLGFVHGLIIANGLGHSVSMAQLVPVGVGVLLIVIGSVLTRVQPNWFVGIRTPWTLSSDAVWRETHRVSGRVFIGGGLVIAAAAFAPPGAVVPLILGTVAALIAVPVVHSYLLWKSESRPK